ACAPRTAATTRGPITPLPPVTSTRPPMSALEIVREFPGRALVILGPADVEPVSTVMKNVDALTRREHLVHQLVETERAALGDEIERAARYAVNSHADRLGENRLLAEAHQPLALDPEHAEVEHLLAPGRRDREGGAGGGMAVQKRAEVEIGEHVGIHHQKMLGQVVE